MKVRQGLVSGISIALATLLVASIVTASSTKSQQTESEKAIIKKLQGLRGLTDADRVGATKNLALEIRKLAPGQTKIGLANALANVSTEGDYGRGTLQEVTTTLELAVKENPLPDLKGDPDSSYQELAQLEKYEHMKVRLKDPAYERAKTQLNVIDEERKKVDFTLTDIGGKSWTLSSLKGKVVLVNFWATWCPPCRKEMPDLQSLYEQFKDKGFVILSISDEDFSKVNPFINQHKYSWPILLDPGRKVNTAYQIQGIPKSFLYNRSGQLIDQTIDMRTKAQFITLLSKAGLR